MRKLLFSMAIIGLAMIACQDTFNNEIIPTQEIHSIDMSDFYVYTGTSDELGVKGTNNSSGDRCYTMKVLNRQLKENPGLENSMYNIEKHTRAFIVAKKPTTPGGGGGKPDNGGDNDVDVLPISDDLGIINIPVYIHIVYPNANSISNSQVTSQMNTLNSDFTNSNVNELPNNTTFENDATNAGFSFSLAGTFRHDDSRSSWGTNDAVKSAYPPISPDTHLNIWVCNIGGGILGYAQFPGGDPDTDGIVLGGDYFGTTSPPYGLGRTATHEIGHYLNLRHIWGDGRCNRDDFVEDTPKSDRPNYTCPTYPTKHCKSPDMTMNYMDYTYDDCMYMFTDGQRNRMRALFISGGARENFIQ
jgi:hypothetical protein